MDLTASFDGRIAMTSEDRVRRLAPRFGRVMGLIFVVVGFATGLVGVVWLGLVVMLVGYFSRLTRS